MEIKQIKYFVEVVRQGGMTQASEHLYIAQSTISKAIKNIEIHLHSSLIINI
jgi:DNA-binding transcriptional LysR family regulator